LCFYTKKGNPFLLVTPKKNRHNKTIDSIINQTESALGLASADVIAAPKPTENQLNLDQAHEVKVHTGLSVHELQQEGYKVEYQLPPGKDNNYIIHLGQRHWRSVRKNKHCLHY
jgi:hypothetical protein